MDLRENDNISVERVDRNTLQSRNAAGFIMTVINISWLANNCQPGDGEIVRRDCGLFHCELRTLTYYRLSRLFTDLGFSHRAITFLELIRRTLSLRSYAALYTLQLSRDHHEQHVDDDNGLVQRVEWEAGLAERRMEQRLLAVREPNHARNLRLRMHEDIERGLVQFDLLQGRNRWWWYALPANEYHLLYCGCTPTGYRCQLCRALCNCHVPGGTCRFCDRFI